MNEHGRACMKIGVIMETPPTAGGAFQQALSTVEMLCRNDAIKYEVKVLTPFEQTRQQLKQQGIDATMFVNRIIRHMDMLSSTVVGGAGLRRLRRFGLTRLGRHLDALLDDLEIDLVILTDATEISLRIGDYPFITTVMDLDHVDHP